MPSPALRRIVVPLAVSFVLLAGGLLASGWLDRTPPDLQVQLPTPGVPLRGEVLLQIQATDAAPGLSALRVWLDDDPPRTLPLSSPTLALPLDTTTLADGPHTLHVEAVDGALADNRTAVALAFSVDNTMPSLEITEGSLRGTQGRTLALFVSTEEPLASLEATVLGKGRRFYEVSPGVWRALLGVAIEQAVGPQMMVLDARDAAGNTAHAEVPVWIEAGSFPAGGVIRLTAQQTAARQDEQARATMRKERDDVYRHKDPEQRWAGPMLRPTGGRRTSAFGRYRTYSDGQRSYHTGTDLADVVGTPVAAAAAGVVRQAGWQHIFGNVVMLDHGQGVSTSYNHLSAVRVQVGDVVQAGDIVGEVGSTGQSTGPHLHWSLVVDGTAVDAEEWLTRDFSEDEWGRRIHLSQVEGGVVTPR